MIKVSPELEEFLRDFILECGELMAQADRDLVELERNPGSPETLIRVFRSFHTMKGCCGMFGFARLERIAHVAEDALGRMRSGALEVSPPTIGIFLSAIDAIKALVDTIEKERGEPDGDDSALIARLTSLSSQPAAPSRGEAPEPVQPPSATRASDQTLRVNIEILDLLMNLVGELVLTRNQLVQLVRADDESRYLDPIQQLNRLTSGLQEAVMKTRMQPIGNAWAKLPRVIRDLEASTGKRIELVMSGRETEIDRQILQAIQDPLLHCVRNSVDHGIESSAARLERGKPAVGTVSLKAYQEGGHILIEISDDGAGIDKAKVLRKAVERGLVGAEKAAEIGERELLSLVFLPGFSTAEKVTEVSGRGVGMDVVKSSIESVGGSVELASLDGAGTTVRLKIPLTLAIISALLVKVGGSQGDVFAIPQVGVVELVRISEANAHLVESVHGARVLRLRDSLLTLVDLSAVLGLEASAAPEFSVVVAQIGATRFGLIVDDILATQEIVVKPVGRLLREINLFAGSTILGDGRVVIILDIGRVACQAVPEGAAAGEESGQSEAVSGAEGERTSLLLFEGTPGQQQAVPLALVARLEEFPASRIERAAGGLVVQYRDSLLPLIPCDASLSPSQGSAVPALIFSDGERSMGLAVSSILDVVEERLCIRPGGGKRGILGAAIVAGKATEIIDTHYFLKEAYPDWFGGSEREASGAGRRILLVEDSQFFRGMLEPILEAQGYSVTVSENGAMALEAIESGGAFDLVLSDVEMPVMDGLELASRIRRRPELAELPILALTSLSAPPDKQKGIAAGFTDYLVKFDRSLLIAAIEKALAGGAPAREAAV